MTSDHSAVVLPRKHFEELRVARPAATQAGVYCGCMSSANTARRKARRSGDPRRRSSDPSAFTRVYSFPDDGTGRPYTVAEDRGLDRILRMRGWTVLSPGPSVAENPMWTYPASYPHDEFGDFSGPTSITVNDDGRGYTVTDPYGKDSTYTDRNHLQADLDMIESWRYSENDPVR